MTARPTDKSHRGLLKLMLKLPAVRGQLQVITARSEGMQALCEAFDDATSTLERLASPDRRDVALLAEYEAICKELEAEVIAECIFYSKLKSTEHKDAM